MCHTVLHALLVIATSRLSERLSDVPKATQQLVPELGREPALSDSRPGLLPLMAQPLQPSGGRSSCLALPGRTPCLGPAVPWPGVDLTHSLTAPHPLGLH